MADAILSFRPTAEDRQNLIEVSKALHSLGHVFVNRSDAIREALRIAPGILAERVASQNGGQG